MIAFGPADGKLYISLGDGGSRDDDHPVGHVEDWYDVNGGGNGQDIEENLLGSILRIDVDMGSPYGIPADRVGVVRAPSACPCRARSARWSTRRTRLAKCRSE